MDQQPFQVTVTNFEKAVKTKRSIILVFFHAPKLIMPGTHLAYTLCRANCQGVGF
jgi:hypothetical protein